MSDRVPASSSNHQPELLPAAWWLWEQDLDRLSNEQLRARLRQAETDAKVFQVGACRGIYNVCGCRSGMKNSTVSAITVAAKSDNFKRCICDCKRPPQPVFPILRSILLPAIRNVEVLRGGHLDLPNRLRSSLRYRLDLLHDRRCRIFLHRVISRRRPVLLLLVSVLVPVTVAPVPPHRHDGRSALLLLLLVEAAHRTVANLPIAVVRVANHVPLFRFGILDVVVLFLRQQLVPFPFRLLYLPLRRLKKDPFPLLLLHSSLKNHRISLKTARVRKSGGVFNKNDGSCLGGFLQTVFGETRLCQVRTSHPAEPLVMVAQPPRFTTRPPFPFSFPSRRKTFLTATTSEALSF